MRKVLVIGSAGFLGRAVCRYLASSFDITPWDLRDDLFSLNAKLMSDARFDAVVNLSVAAEPDRRFIESGTSSWRINVEGVSHLVECSRSAGATFIQFSTREVLGSVYEEHDVFEMGGVLRPKWLVSEEQVTNPSNAYGQSKLVAEWITQSYENGYVLRLSTPYTDEVPPTGGGLIAALLRNCVSRDSVKLSNGGKQFRDPVHAFDIASMVEVLVQSRPEPRVFNCGGGAENIISLTEIARLFNPGIEINEVSGGDLGFAFDIGRAQQCLGWMPKIQLEHRATDLVLRSRDLSVAED